MTVKALLPGVHESKCICALFSPLLRIAKASRRFGNARGEKKLGGDSLLFFSRGIEIAPQACQRITDVMPDSVHRFAKRRGRFFGCHAAEEAHLEIGRASCTER